MGRPGRRAAVALALMLAAFAQAPSEARAIVSEAHLIAGPSAELEGDPDAAMAEDGTGGVVYLRRVDGHEHVFAVQFSDGEWGRPVRVDVGQRFDSSWPRIAAGNGGRLLVTWTQDFGVQTDRMFSATMDPGANGFRPPVPVDFDIGKATSTFPDLAMSRGGQAYLVYNVITDTSTANPPGYLGVDVRLARYSNRLWSAVGSRIDRNSTLPMRQPTAAIAPRIGIDVQGQAVVAWLEPDDDFVDRVWARRVFGGQTGIPLQVSPSVFEERPLRGGVSSFSLDVSGFGQATVAFVQGPGQNGALDAARVMANGMPDVFTEGASKFGDPHLVDETARPSVSSPAVGVDPTGFFNIAFGSGTATLLSLGDDFSTFGVERIDEGVSSADPAPQVDLAETGAAAVAWREQRATGGVVTVQERRADGVVESPPLNAPSGGAVGRPAMGGSGLGDAIVAWSQGTGAGRQIAAAVVDAPPDPFLVLVPEGWQRKRKVPVAWDPSPSAIGGVTYSVSVDDEPVLDGVEGERAKLGPRQIEDGRHKVQIFAVDDGGQETGSLTGRLMVDRSEPKVRVSRRGRVVTVSVSDGPRSGSSGLTGGRIAYGDGAEDRATGKSSTAARRSHRYSRPGKYAIRVEARDRAGNSVSRRVRVRVR